VLFVGDAPATNCVTDMTQVAAIVAAGVTGTPYISTYFIGLSPTNLASALSDFNTVATAAKTAPAWFPQPSTAANIATALRQYRDVVACNLALPMIQGAPPDPGKTTLVVEGGGTTVLTHVAGAANCTANEWYNVGPQRARLCPTACALLLKNAGAKALVKTQCP
jgi:hypothetical protein